jgi:hypothetical protein
MIPTLVFFLFFVFVFVLIFIFTPVLMPMFVFLLLLLLVSVFLFMFLRLPYFVLGLDLWSPRYGRCTFFSLLSANYVSKKEESTQLRT